MSEELSILSLVLQAGPVVQLVMATLVLASVFSWVAIFQRTRVLSRAQKHARLFEDTFWSGAELVSLYKQVVNSPNLIGLEAVFKAGFRIHASPSGCEIRSGRCDGGCAPCNARGPSEGRRTVRGASSVPSRQSVLSAHTSVCSARCGEL